MISLKDLNKVIGVVAPTSVKYYRVLWTSGSDVDLQVFTSLGSEIPDERVDSRSPATLCFDSNLNFFMTNNGQKMCQYNFTTSELDELAGQGVNLWAKSALFRFSDGNFLYSNSSYDPALGRSVTKVHKIDVTDEIVSSATLTVTGYSGIGAVTAYSTDGTYTCISSGNVTLIGAPTYDSNELLTGFNVTTSYTGESNGTIINGKLYTFNNTVMKVRNLVTGTDESDVSISGRGQGSIGIREVEGFSSFRGILLSFEVDAPNSRTIPDSSGNAVTFVSPGRKYISVITREDISDYLDGKVKEVSIKGEDYEVSNISQESSRVYRVDLQTPEIS